MKLKQVRLGIHTIELYAGKLITRSKRPSITWWTRDPSNKSIPIPTPLTGI